jgi:hypothetical protein
MNDFEKLKHLDAFVFNLKLHSEISDGNLDLVKYVITKMDGSESKVNFLFEIACGANQVAIIDYLLHSEEVKNKANININRHMSFLLACEKSLEVVKFLIPLLEFKDDDEKEYVAKHAIYKSCEGGNLELVKYLLSESIINDNFKLTDNSEELSNLVNVVAAKGKIDIFEYLLNLDNNKEIILSCDHALEEIILNCFIESRFEMIEHLFNHKELSKNIDLNKDNDYLFNFLCEQGADYEIEYLIFELKIKRTEEINKIIEKEDYSHYKEMFDKRDLNILLNDELQKNDINQKRPKL